MSDVTTHNWEHTEDNESVCVPAVWGVETHADCQGCETRVDDRVLASLILRFPNNTPNELLNLTVAGLVDNGR